ncbi:hypothetical protein AAIR98_000003 [Elusimicrobium simillimum]
MRGYKKLHEYLLGIENKNKDPQKELVDFFEKAFEFAQKHAGYTQIITQYHVRINNKILDNPSYKIINDMDNDIFNILENVLAKGVKQGVFKNNLDIKITSAYFTSLYMGTLDMVYNKAHYLKSRKVTPKQLIAKSIELAVSSVKRDGI